MEETKVLNISFLYRTNKMDSMQLLNPWWKEAKVNHLLAKLYKRKALIKLKHLMKFRQITIISGLRRVGKSTLMYQIIEQLLESKVKAENIFYYTFVVFFLCYFKS